MPEHLVDATQWQQDFDDIDFWVGRNIIGSTHLCVRVFKQLWKLFVTDRPTGSSENLTFTADPWRG
jgi:hypothetical protein